MKVKNVNLKWYAMRWDGNNDKVEFTNVLYGLEVEIAKDIRKKKILSRDDLRFWLKNELMYHYWCKAENEIAVGGLFSEYPKEFEKIDVWRQLEPNLDRITDYVIKEMKLEL